MRQAILTGTDDIKQLNFTPTLIIGFYQGGYEDSFEDDTVIFKKYFKDIDIIGCSSESNIGDNLPHIDINNTFPCIYMCLDLKKDAYTLVQYDLNVLPDKALLENDKYATLLFHTLLEHSQSHLEAIISFFQQNNNISTFSGAIAGHPSFEGKTSIYLNGQFLSSGETIICYINQKYYQMSSISIHDFTPIGKKMEITKVENNTLIEIEYKPALKTIENICGTLTQDGIESYNYPFFIRSHNYSMAYHQPLSSIHSIDRNKHTISLYKQVQEGDTLQLAIPFSREEQELQLRKLKKFHKKNSISLLFVCIAYKGHWGDMEPIYLMHIFESLRMPFIGIHSFGEIGPLNTGEPSQLQNQTITLTVLKERDENEIL